MQMGRDFFTKAFEEDNSDVEQVVDTPTEEVTTEEVVTPVEATTSAATEEVIAPTEYEVDGEKITIDQIKEWKQNGLRQSDYTRKTQELAEQRKALGHAEEGVSDNPSDSERLLKLERDIKAKELDLEITNLKTKYPDFDEIKVLTESGQRGIYDLEFVYKAMRSDSSVNIEELKNKAIEEYKNEIATKKQTNKEATSGSIVSNASGQPSIDYGDELTSSEKEYCNKRGWSYKQYVEDKNAEYKI